MACTNTFHIIALCGFLGQVLGAQPIDGFLQKISTKEIIHDLDASLSDLLSGQASAAAGKRVAAIEASTWETFQSMPKNELGRLAPQEVRHVVHSYFAREHGVQIKGLELGGMQVNASQVQDMNILRDKAGMLVEGLLSVRSQGQGLSFTDLVAMMTVLEQLILEESVTFLEAAYRLNGRSVADRIDEASLHTVLRSYLRLFSKGAKADLFDASWHQADMASRSRPEAEAFEHNAVSNFDYARRDRTNPFVPRRYSFEVASEIVSDMAQRYGKWQNQDCDDMKALLVALDPVGSGRVPLGLFYAQPSLATGEYIFSESPEYLRTVGALDETSSMPEPAVLISNYVNGPSNCIAASSYSSVCCVSDCDSIMDEIEHTVLAPTASPEVLLDLVRRMSDFLELPRGLPEKLQTIAERHGGEVPIHGRLFSQWLHFAFPHDCPLPAILENSEVLHRSHWSGGIFLSHEERIQSAEAFAPVVGNIRVEDLWSDHELLVAYDDPRSPLGLTAAGVQRAVAQFAALLLLFRGVYGAWRAVVAAGDDGGNKAKKDEDLAPALGFSV